LTALSGELADIGKTQTARVAAGLQLKNYLTSKNPAVRLQYQQAWFSFEPSVRQVIKTNVSGIRFASAGMPAMG
jgi:importin subunit beta-1